MCQENISVTTRVKSFDGHESNSPRESLVPPNSMGPLMLDKPLEFFYRPLNYVIHNTTHNPFA